MSTDHFLLITGALEVGLEGAIHPNLSFEMPTILEGLQPPAAVRAIVTVDDTPYQVVISPATVPGYNDRPDVAHNTGFPSQDSQA